MYLVLRYQFRASHFLCFTHCFHHTNTQAQQDLYWITALLEGECATAAHHKHFISILCSLVVHPAANYFLPHCAGSFLLQGKQKVCYRNANFSETQPYQQTFHPGLETEWKSPLRDWEVMPISPRAAASGEHKARGTDCMREKFNSISRSFSGTWPASSLYLILLIKSLRISLLSSMQCRKD